MKTTLYINQDIKKKIRVGKVSYIDVPLYHVKVEVLFKKESTKVEKTWKNSGSFGGLTRNYLEECGRVMISFPSDNPRLPTVVHELCHATQNILKHIGHDFQGEKGKGGDEPFAYLLGYLMEEYLKLKKKPCQKKQPLKKRLLKKK